jgi:hypothetical protein
MSYAKRKKNEEGRRKKEEGRAMRRAMRREEKGSEGKGRTQTLTPSERARRSSRGFSKEMSKPGGSIKTLSPPLCKMIPCCAIVL